LKNRGVAVVSLNSERGEERRMSEGEDLWETVVEMSVEEIAGVILCSKSKEDVRTLSQLLAAEGGADDDLSSAFDKVRLDDDEAGAPDSAAAGGPVGVGSFKVAVGIAQVPVAEATPKKKGRPPMKFDDRTPKSHKDRVRNLCSKKISKGLELNAQEMDDIARYLDGQAEGVDKEWVLERLVTARAENGSASPSSVDLDAQKTFFDFK
jgi:hypothetical protein